MHRKPPEKQGVKRNIDWSNKLLLRDDERYRCVSMEGEIPYSNYLRIDNSEISARDAAVIIKRAFRTVVMSEERGEVL